VILMNFVDILNSDAHKNGRGFTLNFF